jgi:FkbM family methyltransferase
MRDYDTGIHMYRIVFTKKCKCFDEWFIGNLLYNLQFFTEHVKDEDKTVFYSLFQEYVDFLVANHYPIYKNGLINKYKKYGIVASKWQAINEECSTSTKILIYTGFSNYLWNDSFSNRGGSHKAVAYLAKNLPKEYDIIISGDVEDEVVGNVKYVNRFKLQALLDVEKFHTIIVSRYVSFFTLFPHFKCYQLYLSAHDNVFINNFDCISCDTIIEENIKYINGVICLTTWHKSYIIQMYPCLKDKVEVINNGVVLSSECAATSLPHNKVKNKFVWTSCSYRGLDVLLKLWDKILEVMPDATLDISSYMSFPDPHCVVLDEEIRLIINRHSDSVKHHGQLNTEQLYDLISKAEYWLYTCTFCETSCITALEMLMNEVVCLYYPLAGLNDTVGEYGIKVNPGNEIQSIMNLSEERKAEMRINGKNYAMSCSWENRAKEWSSVLGLGFSESKKNISNLFDATKIENIFLRNKKINYIKNDSCIGFVLKAGYYWEEWMFKYIQENYLENTNMIDLGGNIGTTTLLMSEVLSNNCNIFTFEPVYHDILFKNILDNNLNNKVVIYPCGVGNEIKSLKIKPVNLSDNINFGGLDLMVNLENDCDSVKINIVPLDYFNFDNVSLIKIDVENMEIQVLEGCINLIKKCKPTIIIESHQLNTLEQTSIFKELVNLGYEIFRIPEGSNDFILKIKI